jgi:hypothetical protein
MDYFKEYGSYIIIEPCFNVEGYCDNFALLRNKTNKEFFRIPICDFCEKRFLLHAIGSVESNQLGFINSEKFMLEIN